MLVVSVQWIDVMEKAYLLQVALNQKATVCVKDTKVATCVCRTAVMRQ